MSEKTEPALNAEEWTGVSDQSNMGVLLCRNLTVFVGEGELAVDSEFGALAAPAQKWIALANAALPDDDPRKITRGKLDYIREVARVQAKSEPAPDLSIIARHMIAFADALESLLPPEAA